MGSGLLQKANLLTQEKGLAFSDFIKKYNNLIFAILTKTNNSFFTEMSFGFDGLSILASYSTNDFWEGLLPAKNKIYNFTEQDNSINKLLQFFSFEMKDKIHTISIYRNENKIFLLCNSLLSQDFIHDITFLQKYQNFNLIEIDHSLLPEFEIHKYTLNYQEAIESYVNLQTKNNHSLYELFTLALSEEVKSRLYAYFSKPNICVNMNNFQSNIILFSHSKLEDELIFNHLLLNFQELLANCSELIDFSYIGKSETYCDIQDFLKVK